MSKTCKNNDKYKKIRVERKVSKKTNTKIQQMLENQEQQIFEKFNIRNSNYIR